MKIYIIEHGNDTNRFGVSVSGSASWEEPYRIRGIFTTLRRELREAQAFYGLLNENVQLALSKTWVCAREYESERGETGIAYVLKATRPNNVLVKRGTNIVEQLQIE